MMLLSQHSVVDHWTYQLNSLPFPVRAVEQMLCMFLSMTHLDAHRQHYLVIPWHAFRGSS